MAEQTNGIELNGSVNIGVVVTGSERQKMTWITLIIK